MSSMKTWSYPENDVVNQFKNIFEGIKDFYIDKWYAIDKYSFVYENNKFYYHMAIIKKNQLGYYIDDYVLNKKGELKYNKDFGYFKEKNELIEFIKSKVY